MSERRTVLNSFKRKKYILAALSGPRNATRNSLSHSHAIVRIRNPIGSILCGWAVYREHAE